MNNTRTSISNRIGDSNGEAPQVIYIVGFCSQGKSSYVDRIFDNSQGIVIDFSKEHEEDDFSEHSLLLKYRKLDPWSPKDINIDIKSLYEALKEAGHVYSSMRDSYKFSYPDSTHHNYRVDRYDIVAWHFRVFAGRLYSKEEQIKQVGRVLCLNKHFFAWLNNKCFQFFSNSLETEFNCFAKSIRKSFGLQDPPKCKRGKKKSACKSEVAGVVAAKGTTGKSINLKLANSFNIGSKFCIVSNPEHRLGFLVDCTFAKQYKNKEKVDDFASKKVVAVFTERNISNILCEKPFSFQSLRGSTQRKKHVKGMKTRGPLMRHTMV